MTTNESKTVTRCAVYTRKSSEEGLESQTQGSKSSNRPFLPASWLSCSRPKWHDQS
jgi:hypothetical protein